MMRIRDLAARRRLLRTIIGCYLRRLGGWIASPALTELMTTVGVTQARTRTAISRVRTKACSTRPYGMAARIRAGPCSTSGPASEVIGGSTRPAK